MNHELESPSATVGEYVKDVETASSNKRQKVVMAIAPQKYSPPSSPFPNSFTARALRLTKQSHALYPLPLSPLGLMEVSVIYLNYKTQNSKLFTSPYLPSDRGQPS
ncbi:hypothetical protein QUA43_00425 [Microcoleus sp. N9_B4]